MNMDVRQEVIDFLIDVLLQIGEIDREQWELNKTIYLNKFVLQFKKLWFDRGKSIPDVTLLTIDQKRTLIGFLLRERVIIEYNIIKVK